MQYYLDYNTRKKFYIVPVIIRFLKKFDRDARERGKEYFWGIECSTDTIEQYFVTQVVLKSITVNTEHTTDEVGAYGKFHWKVRACPSAYACVCVYMCAFLLFRISNENYFPP